MDLRDAARKRAMRELDRRRFADPSVDPELPPLYLAYVETSGGEWSHIGIIQLKRLRVRDLEGLRRALGVDPEARFKVVTAATAIFAGVNYSTSSLLEIDA